VTKPGDPQKGKAAEAEQTEQAAKESAEATAQAAAEQAAEASEQAPEQAPEAAEEQPKPKRTRAKKEPAEKAEEPAKPAEAPAPKRAARRETGEPVIVRASARYVRSSPRKARLVCDHIRGKSVSEARAILAFSPRAVAEAWTKLLESAVANAENNHDLVGEDLKIHAVYADAGPTIKRYRPRAMGRATRIRKRTSHLTIQLTPRD
jgi:ribosomal protein L22